MKKIIEYIIIYILSLLFCNALYELISDPYFFNKGVNECSTLQLIAFFTIIFSVGGFILWFVKKFG